ncbi:hypothetical protein LBMAG53_29480 [Planctomycetota bacterium]|nr:hypothetical protein LBMAG53_29480 [Planctomycetota bacterium]
MTRRRDPDESGLGAASRALCGWLLVAAGLAAEPQIDFVAAGIPAHETLRLLSQVGGSPLATATDLAGDLNQPVRLALVRATPIQVRQALGHALQCWFAKEPEPATSTGAVRIVGTRFSRQDQLSIGPLETRVLTSDLVGRDDLVAPVRNLLQPWLGAGCGIDFLASDGLWTATLDAAGQAQLVEALTRLAKAEPAVPPLIPMAAPLIPATTANGRPTGTVLAAQWADAVPAIAATWGISVALASDGDASIGQPLPAMPLAELPAAIARRGAQAALVHGVLCIGRQVPVDRQHPAERRRFAVLPTWHLRRDQTSQAQLVAAVRLRLTPRISQPGWGVVDLGGSLLVVADPPTIHECLEALLDIDRLGLDRAAAAWSDGDAQRTGPRRAP